MGKKQKYDDYYSNGKVEIGRFGNFVFSKNHYTKEEIQRRNKQFASHYDDIKTDIDNTIVEIVNKVKKCNPLILLQNATDLFMMSFLQAVSEIQVEDNARYIEYIQSILVSIKPGNEIVDDKLQSKIMQELFNDIDKLYTKCQYFYIVWAAKAQENDGYRREDIEYIIEAQLMSNVRGNRYQCQQLDDLEKLILPHTKKMEEVYNVTAVDFIEGLRKLEYSLSSAELDAAKGLANEYKIFQQEVQSKSDHEVDSIFDRIQNDGKTESLMSKCFGTELYDVKKVTGWSEELVKSLSWELGENDSFFTKTEFPGWPVQNLPVQRRPFIVIDGVSYCFDYYNLFDNIYRILQKSIIAKDNKYVNTWSDIQKEASESLVAEKLSMLMPNAEIYIGNYYPIGSSLKQMDENDIIAVCDDIIIIAEVKAGSFAYTPALTDLTAHKKSFKELIGQADYQCVRTLEYINKCVDNVCFYTEEKNKKFEFSRNKIRKIYTMCVTVDNFNVFEAKIEKTNIFEMNKGTIAISIDDLDAYVKYFNSELCFLHYLKHRQAATRIKCLMFNDELDHLGMYISQNIYEEYVNDYKECDSFTAIGFREDLDAYFTGLYNKQLQVKKPEQNIPGYMHDILEYLEKNNVKGRVKFAEFLLDLCEDTRIEFDEAIKNCIKREKELGYITPIWVEGDFAYCEFICIPGLEKFPDEIRRKYTYANMLDRKFTKCWFINIELDIFGKIVEIKAEELDYIKHSDEGFSETDISNYLLTIKERRRHGNASNLPIAHRKKIYPNDLCPCGSGLKYKKCCGAPNKKINE